MLGYWGHGLWVTGVSDEKRKQKRREVGKLKGRSLVSVSDAFSHKRFDAS